MDPFDPLEPVSRDELPWKKIIRTASHEIRTPLSSLRTSVEILSMNHLDLEGANKVLAVMNRQIEAISTHLDTLVNQPDTFLHTASGFHERT